MGNRVLIIFTDGEELSGDAVKTAKAAADAGVRIFTVGVGTPQGSLIPITTDSGETSFVKDSEGKVVKSKLDDKRLREVAEATGGFYLHLENGPRTMQQIQTEGLAKMQAAEMDVRLSRRPIERYEWPLGAALIALALSILIPERKRMRQRIVSPPARNAPHSLAGAPAKAVGAAAAILMFVCSSVFAAVPGINAYEQGKFEDAYKEFQDTLKSHPQSRAEEKLQFDSGTAAYKLKDYNKALESFSQALLTPDTGLQTKGHYNLGNTLYQRGEEQKDDEKKLSDWTNALDHYEQSLKLDPQNKEARENYEYVKRKIDELKNKKEQQQQSPSPTPPQQKKQDKKDHKDQKDQQNQNQQQQQQKDQQQKDQNNQQQQQQQQQQNQQNQQQQQNQQNQQDQKQAQNQQSQSKSGNDKDQKDQQQKDQQKDQSQAKNEPQKKQQQQPGESPSPSPGSEKQQQNQGSPTPSPGQQKAEQSPSPGEGEKGKPSPSPGEGDEGNSSPTPAQSPQKKFAGEVKGAAGDTSQKPADKSDQVAAEAEQEKEGQMSERQALALLESMKDEEARVRLDERKVKRHVYNDW
jgi:Ca-activated chloride channel family protein